MSIKKVWLNGHSLCCSMASSIIRPVCWKCSQSFATARERKNHMATKEHGCLRVLCPFCTKQTSIRRSSPELREHCEAKHPKEIQSLAKDFFSEANGFWLARYPKDYIQLVPQPTQPVKEDDAATQARTLIRKLYRGTKEAEEIEAGWKLAPPPKKRKRESSLESEQSFKPDYEESTYSPHKPQTWNMPLTPYSVDEAGNGAFRVLLAGEDGTTFKVVLSKTFQSQPKDMMSLFRRVKEDAGGYETASWRIHLLTNELRRHLAKSLGVDGDYISNVFEGRKPFSSPPRKTSRSATKKEKTSKASAKKNRVSAAAGSPSETPTGSTLAQEVSTSAPAPSKTAAKSKAPQSVHPEAQQLVSPPEGQQPVESAHDQHPAASKALQSAASTEVQQPVTPAKDPQPAAPTNMQQSATPAKVLQPEAPAEAQLTAVPDKVHRPEVLAEAQQSAQHTTVQQPATERQTSPRVALRRLVLEAVPQDVPVDVSVTPAVSTSTGQPEAPAQTLIGQGPASGVPQKASTAAEMPNLPSASKEGTLQAPPPADAASTETSKCPTQLQPEECLIPPSPVPLQPESAFSPVHPASLSDIHLPTTNTTMTPYLRICSSPAPSSLIASRSPSPLLSSKNAPTTSQSSILSQRPQISNDVREMLAWGSMPLFPAARRNWGTSTTVKFNALDWPPSNWQGMTPDQRLLHWEYASLTLEKTLGRQFFGSRGELLDRYNFLALPGTKFPPLDSCIRKSRFYIYETLRNSPSVEFVNQIKQTMMARDPSLDVFIKAVNDSNIPLRI